MKKIKIWHPLLLAACPILALYAHNIDETPFLSFLIPFAFLMGFSIILWVILLKFIKSAEKSALITSLFLIIFSLYGHIHAFLLTSISQRYLYRSDFRLINTIPTVDGLLHAVLLGLFVGLFIWGVKRILKSIKSISIFTRLLNYMSVFLVVFSLFSISLYVASLNKPDEGEESYTTGDDIQEKRDIYYIILDGYARADVLKKYYDYDNSQFIGFLRNNKFYVPETSYANYGWTSLSLASSLNFKYLNYLTEIEGEKSNDVGILYEMIKRNRASLFLKSRAYQFIHFNSTWGATLENPYADKAISYKKGLYQDEFFRIFAKTSLLNLFDSLMVEDLARVHLNTFEKLPTVSSDSSGPIFVFAHMVLPHHPYLFDRNGHIRKHATLYDQFQSRKWASKDEYLEQLIFVNSKITEIVKTLLSRPGLKPIIIIQSDHGPQIFDIEQKAYKKARMSNFDAFYLPQFDFRQFRETVTPVNTFRFIFNNYFKTDFEILDDKIYFSEMEKPYKFEELNRLD